MQCKELCLNAACMLKVSKSIVRDFSPRWSFLRVGWNAVHFMSDGKTVSIQSGVNEMSGCSALTSLWIFPVYRLHNRPPLNRLTTSYFIYGFQCSTASDRSAMLLR